MKTAAMSCSESGVCSSRCCVPSPQSNRNQSALTTVCTARPETLRWRVGVPEDVPKKVSFIITVIAPFSRIFLIPPAYRCACCGGRARPPSSPFHAHHLLERVHHLHQ